jgi:hypothetical protein
MTQVQNKLGIQQDIIVQLLAQLTVDYQNTLIRAQRDSSELSWFRGRVFVFGGA